MSDVLYARQAQEIAARHTQPFTPPDSPIEATALEALCKRASGLSERLHDALSRIANSVNRAAGVEPKGQPENGTAAPSNGLLDDLSVEMRRIDELIQELAAQADRLECIA